MENILKANVKYPNANQQILSSYQAMMNRCNNPNNQAYHLYGGNGVSVCKEWEEDYFLFEKWSLNNGWEKGLVIDKDIIGTGKLYSPLTCKWATKKENSRHTSKSVRFNYGGEQLIISEICERKGIKKSVVYSRLRHGMDLYTAISKPLKIYKKNNLK